MWGTAPDVTLILSISQSSESYRGCTVVSNSIVYSKCLRWVLKYEIRRWRRNGMNISPRFYQKIFETFTLQIFLCNWYSIFDLKRRVPISVHSLLNIKVNLESSILHDLQHFHTLNSNEISKSKTFPILCVAANYMFWLYITSRWNLTFQDGHKSIRIFSEILTFFLAELIADLVASWMRKLSVCSIQRPLTGNMDQVARSCDDKFHSMVPCRHFSLCVDLV